MNVAIVQAIAADRDRDMQGRTAARRRAAQARRPRPARRRWLLIRIPRARRGPMCAPTMTS
jgi:hypothetical protein